VTTSEYRLLIVFSFFAWFVFFWRWMVGQERLEVGRQEWGTKKDCVPRYCDVEKGVFMKGSASDP